MKKKLLILFIIFVLQNLFSNVNIFGDTYESNIIGMWSVDEEQFINSDTFRDAMEKSYFDEKLFLEWLPFYIFEFSNNEVTLFLLPDIKYLEINSITQQENMYLIETEEKTLAINIIDNNHINLIPDYISDGRESVIFPLVREENLILDKNLLERKYERELMGKWIFDEEMFLTSGLVESFSDFYNEHLPENLEDELNNLKNIYSLIFIEFSEETITMNFNNELNGISEFANVIPIIYQEEKIIFKNLNVNAIYPYIIVLFKDENRIQITLGLEFTLDNNIFVLYLKKDG